MTLPEYIGYAIAILLIGLGAARFIYARLERDTPDTGDDCRQIDIIKRGQVCPWTLRE